MSQKVGDGWKTVKSGTSISYPSWKWYQPIKRWKFKKIMKQFTPGERIKLGKPIAFTESFEIRTKVSIAPKDTQDEE